ncbi:MAG TPA: hypothetical protein EYG03_02260, partial [Planctomycetes bacterium]|nr:hypothetical protein [Planctomycetota bacterium]
MAVHKLFSFGLCTFLAALGGHVVAEDMTFDQLLQRLEKTEQRLIDLEQQKLPVFRTASTSYLNAPPVPLPPVVETDNGAGNDVEPGF